MTSTRAPGSVFAHPGCSASGYLVEEQGLTYLADIGIDNPLKPLQAASCTYRIALGPRAGQKVLKQASSSAPGRRCAPPLNRTLNIAKYFCLLLVAAGP